MAKKPYKRSAYAEKLLDPRWQKLRLEVMNRDHWACCGCGTTTDTLSVHHCFYEYGKEPWEYSDWTLRTLCDGCHQEAEYLREWFKKFPPTLSMSVQDRLRILIANLNTVSEAQMNVMASQFMEILTAVRLGKKERLKAAFNVLDSLPLTDPPFGDEGN